MYSMTVFGCNLNPSEGGGDMITGWREEFQWAQPSSSSQKRKPIPVLDIFSSMHHRFSPLSSSSKSLHSTILTMIMITREIYGDMMTKARHEFWWATVFNLTNSNSHYLDSQLGNKKHLQMLLIKDIALVLCNFRTEHQFILGSFLKVWTRVSIWHSFVFSCNFRFSGIKITAIILPINQI